ncbi:MAG: hypothetical protein CME06_11245, partial [Gemmatimonadetes bacterium]|nr:hypothetical protein [Gemmatimonadota bacterium]
MLLFTPDYRGTRVSRRPKVSWAELDRGRRGGETEHWLADLRHSPPGPLSGSAPPNATPCMRARRECRARPTPLDLLGRSGEVGGRAWIERSGAERADLHRSAGKEGVACGDAEPLGGPGGEWRQPAVQCSVPTGIPQVQVSVPRIVSSRLRETALHLPRRIGREGPSMDSDALLAHLLKLDAQGRHGSSRPYVEERIDSWGPEVFEAVAVAQWDAGDETERWAGEEQRRGLPGLGPLSKAVRAGIDEGRKKAETGGRGVLGGRVRSMKGAREGVLSAGDLAMVEIGGDEVTSSAEAAMLRWEAWQRIEDVVFAKVVERISTGTERDWTRVRLGREIAALLRGTAVEGIEICGLAANATALGGWLLARGRGLVEPFLAGLESADFGDLGASRGAAVAIVVAKMEGTTGRNEEARCRLEAMAEQVRGGRWATRASIALCGLVCESVGPAHALGAISEAPEQARAHRDRRGLADALRSLGLLHHETGSPDRARELFECALEIHGEVGNRRSEGVVLGNLGNLRKLTGSLDRARELYESALEIHREVGDRAVEGIALGNLGTLHHETGSPDRARRLYEAMDLCLECKACKAEC